MKRLGLDLDGVVYDFDRGFNRYMDKKGLHLVNPFQYNMELRFPQVKNIHKQIYDFQNSSKLKKLPLIEGAELIHELKEDYDLFFLTNRPNSNKCRKYTLNRLKSDDFLKSEDDIYFVRHGTKGMFCNAWNLDFFVDDYPENLVDVMKDSMTKPILFDQVYNTSFNSELVKRVKNWEELFDYLK